VLALVVASGLTVARTRSGQTFADFTACRLELWPSALWAGLQVVPLRLDNGSPHAPKPRGPWIAALALSCDGRMYGLPTHARWLEQVEMILSKVPRDVLTPNDFPRTLALEKPRKHYFDALNQHPKPMQGT